MRILITSILLYTAFILNPNTLFSQQNENSFTRDKDIQYEKLYLHTDREFYFQGDSIWFKAYYVDGQSQQLVTGLNDIHVELIDSIGQTIQSQVLLITDGLSSGNIQIPDSLNSGNYLLRAFTDFQKHFGEDAFFYKTLTISSVKNPIDLTENISPNNKREKLEIDVSYYPEGGFILEGQLNIIGVKATDENGKSILVHGNILDSNGHTVSSFATSYRGMGRFHFTPQIGEKYSVQMDNFPNYQPHLSVINKRGIKIEFLGKEEPNLLFQVTTNSKNFLKKQYNLVIMNRGQVLLHQNFTQKENKLQIKILQSILPAGINRFILLDDQLKPISERLFFSNNLIINNLDIKLNQNRYEQRSKINMSVSDKNEFSDDSFSCLSVAVIAKNSVNLNKPGTNILSSLLIDSELKGYIESASDYFIDENEISSANKLNLLMLTQGWSKYLWNSIPEKSITHHIDEYRGITIKGKIKRLFSKKAVADGEVILGLSSSDGHNIFETKSDIDGRFSFSNLLFTDTATVFIQARNKNGNKTTEVLLDSIFKNSPIISQTYLQSAITTNKQVNKELQQQKYYNDQDVKKFNIESGSILLDEVTVKAKKIEKDDGYTRSYGMADYTFKVSDANLVTDNVQDFLQRSVPGIAFTQSSIILRQRVTNLSGQPTPSLVLLDGMPLGINDLDFVKSIPMSAIDKIEILKSAAKCVIYGSQANGGVVAIYSNRGANINNSDAYIRGVITEKIAGYSGNKEFYSPKYTTENIDTKKPDHRITLYWNPNVITENGKTSLSFYSSDDITTYKVFVEGITSNGEVCLGTAEFKVDY